MSHTRYTIAVTQEIINKAVIRDSSHCVIAEAVLAQIPNASHVSVDLQTIRWSDRTAGRRYIALTPASAQILITDFDEGILPSPQTIRVQPFQSIKTGQRAHTPATPTVHTTEKVQSGGRHRNVMIEHVQVEGGSPPPSAALSNRVGRRREFGLRLLRR